MEKFSSVIDLILAEIDKRFINLLGANKDDNIAKVVQAFSVFNHHSWPATSDSELLYFGSDLIQILIDWFHDSLEKAGCQIDCILLEWKQLKLLVGNEFKNKSYNEVWAIMLTKTPYNTPSTSKTC
ncbi:hypothetical protein SNE40_002739 [Patella caerulea]|uniref:Uncharacterized protein n=1 Tax=Patella caerulea TaxID=87958 RepID=A0AAN8K6R4_PATCE